MKKIISIVLALAMLTMCLPMQFAMAAEAPEIFYNSINVNFPLSAANGANSLLFVEEDDLSTVRAGYNSATDTRIDWYGRAAYGNGGLNLTSLAFIYGIDEASIGYPIFKQDSKGTYWEIKHYNDKVSSKYYINPYDKAIKLTGGATTEAPALSGCTIDVEDGKYSSIGFLAAQYGADPRNVTVELVYEDGTKTETITLTDNLAGYKVLDSAYYTNAYNTNGVAFFRGLDVNNNGGAYLYDDYSVVTDENRILKSVKFSVTSTWDVISIISLWGTQKSIKSVFDKITIPEELTEENLSTAQNKADEFLAYLIACGYSYNDLEIYAPEMKERYDIVKTGYIEQIFTNKIASIDENVEITSTNIYDIKNMLAEIENYKTLNSLEYSQEQEAKISVMEAKIAAVEEAIIVADIKERIQNLPSAEEITENNYSTVSAEVKSISQTIKDYNLSSKTELAESLETLSAVSEKLELVSQDLVAVIPLDIQEGANIRLFLEQANATASYKNYIKWKDFIQKNYISGTVSATSNPYAPGALVYSASGQPSATLISAPDGIWTVNGTGYRIGEDINGIRLHGAKTVSIDDELAKKYMTSYFAEATVDLENGIYSKLHLLAANPHGYQNDTDADVQYVITYTDGTTKTGNIAVHYKPQVTQNSSQYGYVTTTAIYDGGSVDVIFAEHTIDVDSSKQLDKIKFTCSESQRMVYIAGISGETIKLSELKSVIESKLDYSFDTVGTESGKALLEIEDLVKEYEAAGGDVSRIEGIEKFEADIAEYNAGIIELESTESYVDFGNTYFEAKFSKNITVTDGAVKVLKGDSYLATDKFSVITEGDKLTVKIPDDHKTDATYNIEITSGILSADNPQFYVDKAINESFEGVGAVTIDKFELSAGTVTAVVTNNMLKNKQSYILIIAGYTEKNKKVGARAVKGILTEKGTPSASVTLALDAATFENGVKIECYLSDGIDTINYLDDAATIIVTDAE